MSDKDTSIELEGIENRVDSRIDDFNEPEDLDSALEKTDSVEEEPSEVEEMDVETDGIPDDLDDFDYYASSDY